MNKPEVSLIISFYKRIDYLKLILEALKNQTYKNFEVIIADDGSPLDIVNQVEKLSVEFPFTIKHVWHEDKGFRKNKILNCAIEAASSDYLIFIDGDCIPHTEFVKEHNNHKKTGTCLTGRRVNLSEKITDTLSEEKIKNNFLENNFHLMILDGLFGNSDYVEKGFYIKGSMLRDFFNKKRRGLLGCNFSLFKEDLLKINGFDERYEAPSIGEDSDIEFRLRLNGVQIKSLNNIAIQYHLYHKLQPRPAENVELFEKVKREKTAYTPFGVKK